jgi:hypothetical protein
MKRAAMTERTNPATSPRSVNFMPRLTKESGISLGVRLEPGELRFRSSVGDL